MAASRPFGRGRGTQRPTCAACAPAGGVQGVRVSWGGGGWAERGWEGGAGRGRVGRRESEGSIPTVGRAQPDDIDGPVLFLVSALARHVQGEILNVNGGSVLVG